MNHISLIIDLIMVLIFVVFLTKYNFLEKKVLFCLLVKKNNIPLQTLIKKF